MQVVGARVAVATACRCGLLMLTGFAGLLDDLGLTAVVHGKLRDVKSCRGGEGCGLLSKEYLGLFNAKHPIRGF